VLETLNVSEVNLVSDRDGFVWKSHEKLELQNSVKSYPPGFHPQQLMQLSLPATVNSVCIHTGWGVIATGTAHGFALFDYMQRRVIMTKCTLNPNDANAADDHPMARRKSFKKSLRESFRKLRKSKRARRGPDTPG